MPRFSPRLYLLTMALCATMLFYGAPGFAATQTPEPQSWSGDQARTENAKIPPEVLQAIYPGSKGSVRHSFSDQPKSTPLGVHDEPSSIDREFGGSHRTSVAVGASHKPPRPLGANFFDTPPLLTPLLVENQDDDPITGGSGARFNDRLVKQMGAASIPVIVTGQEPQLQAAVPQAEVATGTESASDRTNENSTHPTDSTAVVPANHLTDIEFHVGLNPSARPNNTDPPIEIQDRAKYRIPDNHRNREQDLPADSGGPTLAELLADSSREIVFDPAPDNNQKSRPGSLGQVDPKGLNSTDLSRSELASRTADTSALAETMQRIAVSLCFVLAVACVLLLVIKRWLFSRTSLIPKTGVVKPNRDSTSIRILNQLRLDAKSLLYLIKANEQQVLVAVDMAGIKSVVTLNSDFESALEDLSEQQAIRPRSIVEQLEAEFGQPATYSPSTLQKKSGRSGTADDSAELLSSATAPARPRQHAEVKAESDLESEMKRKLAEILRSSLSNNSR